MKKLVSIIIPVYNAESYLNRCIESVLRQTYKNIELVLINDGSTDGSEIIIERYLDDKRIVYRKSANNGVSTARNLGISMSSGEYILFVDSDDYIKDELVEFMVENIKDNDLLISGYSEYYVEKDDFTDHCCAGFCGKIEDFLSIIPRYLNPPFLLGPCFKLFKSNIIQSKNLLFPIELSFGEDAEFVLNYMENINSVICVDYIGYVYVKSNKESLSSSFRNDKMDIYNRLNNHISELFKSNNIKNMGEYLDKRLVFNFLSFTKDIIYSSMSYKDKKDIFITEAKKYQIEDKIKIIQDNIISIKLMKYALKINLFYIVYFPYILKSIK